MGDRKDMNRIMRLLTLLIMALAVNASAQYPAPYVSDSNTLHLYHFDIDGSDSTGSLDLPFSTGVSLDTSFSGFSNAVNTFDGISGSGPYAGDSSTKTLISDLVGPDGAFTFEAIVMPMVEQGAIPNHMEIMSLEDGDNSNGQRGFQFRINTDGTLRFQTLAGIVTSFDAPISFSSSKWYHAAVTYNGQENTSGNMKLYWTDIDSSTSVQEVGSFQLTQDLDSSVDGYFSVGNELRPSTYSENFEGLIDEVRISSVERSASDMSYTTDSDTLHYYRFEGTGNDQILTNPIDLTGGNGANVADSIDGYGLALTTYDGTSGDAPYAGDNSNKYQISDLIGTSGAFTFEAWVKPAIASSELPNHMQIISLEDDDGSAGERGFHFRISSDGNYLQFTSLAGTDYSFNAPVSFVPDTWYHAAVTYNGSENTSDNLKLYWSRMYAHSTVQEVGSFQAPADLQLTTDGYFCVGNELRTTGGYSENFEGLIDEVRISQIARTPSDLLYLSNDGLPAIVTNPENTTVKTGDTAVMQSSFTAETIGSLLWYKASETGDIQIQNSDDRFTITQDYNSETLEYTSYLTIDNCEVSDLGDYYLAISNDSDQYVYSESASLKVEGLWAHWTLNESDYTGTYYKELIAGKDALVESIPIFSLGADNSQAGSVSITPDSGWATVNSENPIVLSDVFTISFWAKWQAQTSGTSDLLIDSGNGTEITVSNGLLSGRWQHICAVFDGSYCKLYLDGVLTSQSEWVIPQGMTAELNIGSAGLGEQSFNGELDDIRIYNYVLSNTEIAQLRFDFADLRSCILSYADYTDWSGPQGLPDCIIDIYDLNSFANNYLGTDSNYDIAGPDNAPDGIVSMYDFALLASAWLDCGLFPNCPSI